jgi:hypothetical protein
LSVHKRKPGQKPDPIPVPPLPKQTVILFELGKRQGKELASLWCLRDVYVPLQHELDANYQAAMIAWQREAIYKLVLYRRVYGQYRADNLRKKMVRQEHIHTSILFEGTNTNFLQAWFRDCRDSYQLGPDLWLELHYREWEENLNQHGEWHTCEDALMHDFLG